MAQSHRDPWRIIRDLPCLSCGYNLKTKQGPMVICPECGHTNDLTKPEQWKPAFEDGTDFNFSSLIVLCLNIWLFPVIILVLMIGIVTKAISIENILLIIILLFPAIQCIRIFIKGIKKQEVLGLSRAKLVLQISLASAVTSSPAILGGAAYALGLLLTWYWAVYIALGFLISGLCLWIGMKTFPDTEDSKPLPGWKAYCDAVVKQTREGQAE